ncbi:serine hydrolase domain-containing protein [Streptomyces angustmyceticus]|uniref:serine hydrolase domain-containing protein n=1 Tax=Streptomyces angustmyceticus TaxID=285578 RepID=UPI00384F4ECA
MPGAAALTTRAGYPAARYATAGVADLRSGRAIGPRDHFRAGSLTKTLVATVVLQLVAEGRLSLHDSAAAHLPPGVPAAGDGDRSTLRTVTIRQLLDHTSGLFNYTRDPRLSEQLFGSGFGAHRYDSHTPAELLRIALGHPPVAAPGTRYSYSNTNYLVLGLVIRAVTGHPYATEIRRRILVPARLGHTSFPGTDPVLPRPHGRAYSRAGDRRVDATSLDPSRAGAAGEMVTTLGDLNRFFSALLRGRFLAPRQMAEIRDEKATGGTYGLGLYATRLPCGVTVWGHDGEINGSYVRTAGTADGRHIVSYRVNTDTLPDPAHGTAVLTAEFCAARHH